MMNLGLLSFFLILCFPEMKEQFKGIKRRTWMILILILIIGLIMAISLPKMHFFYTKEYSQLQVAKNILLQGKAETCEYLDYNLIECQNYKGPLGVPLIFALSFSIFGISNYVAINTVAFFGGLSIILMFLFCYLLFRNETLALFSAFILTFSPLYSFFSSTANNYIIGNLFILLTLIGFFTYIKNRNLKILLFSVISLAFVLQLSEVFIFFPVLIFLIFSRNKRISYKFWLSCAIFLLLSLPIFFQTLNLQFPFLRLSSYFPVSGVPFFYPLLCLSLPGIYFLGKEKKEIFLFLLAWIFLFFFLAFFYSDFYFDYFLIFYPSLILFTVFGIKKLSDRFGNKSILILMALFLCFFSYSFYSISNPQLMKSSMIVRETRIADNIENIIPENCYVMTATPEVLRSTSEAKTIRIKNVNNEIKERILQETGCFFFFYNTWCILEKKGIEQTNECDFRADFNFTHQSKSYLHRL